MRWVRGTAEAPPSESSHLAPIRIFTGEIELTGSVAPTGQRITDMLLRGHDLAFLPSGAAPDPENWIRISPHEILLVAPPPLGSRRGWQEDRRQRAIALRVGDYRIRGTIHLEPGTEVGVDLHRRQAFLPLTDARVRGSSSREESFEVVIVNAAKSTIGD